MGAFSSYKGETWFSQWEKPQDDPDIPMFVEAPGSEGRGTYTITTPVHYVLHLSGVQHINPQIPRLGQSGSGVMYENRLPKPVTWKTMSSYPQ